MITNTLIGYNGRFGNQLFQFASAIGIAKKLGYEAVFPLRNTTNYINDSRADGVKFLAKLDILDYFDIDSKYFSDNIIVNQTLNEKFFHFDETMFTITDNTNLHGFFQSEKYFEHCKEELIEILNIKKHLLESATKILPKKDKELVAIHVRRSDYLVLSHYHTVNGVEYINSAIEALGDKNNYHFIVCSDDPIWCNSIWGNDNNFTIMNTGLPEIDFALMTLCNHHIIANSSFSWWSSYLSKNKNKKIVSPKNWFGPNANINTKDLYTKNMIII
jgi:hypothetical protein